MIVADSIILSKWIETLDRTAMHLKVDFIHGSIAKPIHDYPNKF